ncbi:regulator of microtubule dynamics protein 3-like [Diadema setosum]|uniref:regulator of microtubule dynamics protein 3-like n=1 Tax=Diadema setosum TaxID=31175 RepID=UPI003B3B4C0F
MGTFSKMFWRDFGIGVLVGASTSVIIQSIFARSSASELRQLRVAVADLQREWKAVRGLLTPDAIDGDTVQTLRNARRPGSSISKREGNGVTGYNERPTGSSSDEEDLDFEEANEGFTSPFQQLGKGSGQGFESISVSQEELMSFLSEIDELFAGSETQQEEALRRLLAKESQFSSKTDFLWRLARAKVLVSEFCRVQGNDEERRRLVFEARDDAKTVIDLNEEVAEGHKYYAITQGIITDWVSFTEAAALGKEYKTHMERAIELKPREPYLNHLYGRFLFNIANLGWMQRKAAVMMYSLPQSLSVDDALTWFNKAEELQPGFSNLNPFYSAKCCIAKGETDAAVEYLQQTISFPGKSFEEKEVRRQAEELLLQYQ